MAFRIVKIVGTVETTPAYWKEPVQSYDQLPTTGNSPGDARVVIDEQAIYVWDGSQWVCVRKVSSSVTLAANDTPEPWKRYADIICDGTNDELDIENAISLLSSKGGKITLLEGTYNIQDTIDFNGVSNITLEGMGDSSLLDWTANATDTPAINILNSSGIRIRNLAIDQHYTGTPLDASHAINIQTSSHILVKNVLFKNIVEYAVHIVGESANYTKDVIISHNRVENGYAGFYPDWYLERTLIMGNMISGVDTGMLVEYNQISTQIINNTIEASTIGIGFGAENGIMAQNIIRGPSMYGIIISSTAVGAIVAQNTLTCNGGTGIALEANNKASLIGNYISGADTGILVKKQYNKVMQNTVTDCVVGINCDCSYCYVEHNTVLDIQQEGIKLYRGDYNNVRNNVVENTSQESSGTYSAIYVYGSNRDSATYNKVCRNLILGSDHKYAIEVGAYAGYTYILKNAYQSGVSGGILATAYDFEDDNFEVI